MADSNKIAESRDEVPEENIRQGVALCMELTNEHGRQLLQLMFEIASDRLAELASDPKAEDAKVYREASRTLGSSSGPVMDNFSRLFSAVFEEQGSAEEAPSGDFSMGLSLVDDEALEKEILVKRMSSRAAAETQPQFSKLNRRFCFLQNRRIKPADSPLSPQSLAGLMNQAIEPLEVPERIKNVLYDALDQEFANALGYLYSELNELLIDLGILPEIKHHVWRAEVSTRSLSRAGLTESQRKALEELRRPEDEDLQAMLAQIAKASEQTPGEPVAVPDSVSEFRRDADQIAQMLQNLADSGEARAGNLLDSLDQKAEQSSTAQPAGAIREIIQQADSLAVQFARPFTRRSDSREAYMAGKLAAPLARLAAEDPSVLTNEQHALRLALNDLAGYANYLEASDPAVRDEILEEFEDMTEGFALLDFQDPETIASFATNVSHRSNLMKLDFKEQVKRLSQFEEGRARLSAARHNIADMLRKALTGNRYPEPAVAFFAGKWASILVHCYLNREADAPSWQAARGATDKMAVLFPQLEQGIPDKLQAEFGALLKTVWNQLVKHTGYRGSPSDLVAELGLHPGSNQGGMSAEKLADLAPLLGMGEVNWVTVSADSHILASIQGQVARGSASQSAKAYQLWKDRLRPGTWVEFTGEDQAQRCRLMKVFGEGERCVFVDGLGRSTRTLNALEVLEQVKQGKLKKTA